MSNLNSAFLHAADLIASADALVVAAGAGMGVDSGLPDFRGNDGFWRAYPALAKANMNFVDVASPRTFVRDPSLAWGFYGHRLKLYRQTIPHAGFDILRGWADRMLLGSRVFTSNVDGQFQKAGLADDDVHECHGSLHYLQCLNECDSGVWSAAAFTPEVDEDACRLLNSPPVCPSCGSIARPNVLMFSDWNWVSKRSDAQLTRERLWLDSIVPNSARVVVVEMGAGTAIPSVRHFGQQLIHELGARLIRINPREAAVPSSLDVAIPVGSLAALQGIDAFVRELHSES